jgi:DNA-binding Lrp family transcriptional regulator
MIKCEPEKEGRVMEKLSTLKSVKEIHQAHGNCNIHVKLENTDGPELKEMIDREILGMKVVLSITNLYTSSVM